MGEPAGLLDEHVDRLCAAVAQAVGAEVGEDLRAPGPQGPAEPGDLGDRAGVQAGEDLLGEQAALAQAGGAAVDRAQLLLDRPGELDLPVRVADGQPGLQPAVLPLREVLQAVPQNPRIL